MIILETDDQAAALDATRHINRLVDGDTADHESLMALRHHEGVQAAADALAQRLVDIFARHGAGRVIADAVNRVHAKSAGHFTDSDRVLQELEDMYGEAGILAECVAHAARLEDRLAGAYEFQRRVKAPLVQQRLGQIAESLKGASAESAECLSSEAHDLHNWLETPWLHPDELPEISAYIADVLEDIKADAPQEAA